jgi:hypothetical protein
MCTIQRHYFARERERGSVCEDFDVIIDRPFSSPQSMLDLVLPGGFAERVEINIDEMRY